VKLNPTNFLNLYRYGGYNTPFINRNDNRMTPNTFEGYTLTGSYGGEDGAPGVRYGAGYIDRIKERNADNFIWMSTAAGAKVKSGVVVGGALFSSGPFSIGAVDYFCADVINIGYAETRYTLHPTNLIGLALAAQYTDQRSVGNDELTGSYFSTRQFGIKSEASYQEAILTLSYTVATKGSDLQNPWGGYPGYTSVQVEDFNDAGEQAFLAKAAYDLG
jgi:hypothetical protein